MAVSSCFCVTETGQRFFTSNECEGRVCLMLYVGLYMCAANVCSEGWQRLRGVMRRESFAVAVVADLGLHVCSRYSVHCLQQPA